MLKFEAMVEEMSELKIGDIFEVEPDSISGQLTKFGVLPYELKALPEGSYYVINETVDKGNFIISNVEYLKGGYYTLGKIYIYKVPKEELFGIKPVDKVQYSEIVEVTRFLKEIGNRAKNTPS